jgi:nucleotide-binding universal stress UspA family protein
MGTSEQAERVLVGVNGSRASRRALLWATHQAQVRCAELLVVHVRAVATDAVGRDDRSEELDSVLTTSAAAASDMEPDIAILTRGPRCDSVSDYLVSLSAEASLLVIGVDPTRPRNTHGALGPIEDRVAVHALCPVVTVAGTLSSIENAHARIVVGWTDNHTGHQALQAAATEAVINSSVLTVVTVPTPVDPTVADLLRSRPDEPDLIDAVSNIERLYPGLQIDITHLKGAVTDLLVQQSSSADLLVLGCHHSEQAWSIRTGPVAESVMRLAHCPVMLVGRLAKARHRVIGTSSPSPPPESGPSDRGRT